MDGFVNCDIVGLGSEAIEKSPVEERFLNVVWVLNEENRQICVIRL